LAIYDCQFHPQRTEAMRNRQCNVLTPEIGLVSI